MSCCSGSQRKQQIQQRPIRILQVRVLLPFPIWWGEEPRILDTFVEKYSFEGITVIPFCTSGGSGIGRSGPNMEDLAGAGT